MHTLVHTYTEEDAGVCVCARERGRGKGCHLWVSADVWAMYLHAEQNCVYSFTFSYPELQNWHKVTEE